MLSGKKRSIPVLFGSSLRSRCATRGTWTSKYKRRQYSSCYSVATFFSGVEIEAWGQRCIKRGRKPVLVNSSYLAVESGREDLNLRPPQPHCGALPGCATPRHWNNSSIADNSPHSQGLIASDHSTKYARNCCTSANPCSHALAAIRWESKSHDTIGTNFDLL